MEKKVILLLFLFLSGCGTVSQKAPDPFGSDLHHKMDFLEPREIQVVYPAGLHKDSLGQDARDDSFYK